MKELAHSLSSFGSTAQAMASTTASETVGVKKMA
jgi:hypothetical protein